MDIETSSSNRRGFRRFMASGVVVALSGAGLLAAGSGLHLGAVTGHHPPSIADLKLRAPIVSMAVTPDRKGFWLYAADGGVFSYGDAQFYGSGARLELTAPIIGMRVSPKGDGYWLYASDGGVFAFGNAHYYGSAAGVPGADAIVSMRVSRSGNGYQLTDTAGNVYSYGEPFAAAQTLAATSAQPMKSSGNVARLRVSPRRGHHMHLRHKRHK